MRLTVAWLLRLRLIENAFRGLAAFNGLVFMDFESKIFDMLYTRVDSYDDHAFCHVTIFDLGLDAVNKGKCILLCCSLYF